MPLSEAELDRLYSTELTAAVKKEDLSEVKRLLELGADPNACGAGDSHPVCHAAVKGMVDIFDALVAAGADPIQEHANGVLTVHLASRNNRTELLDRILKTKPDYIDSPDGEGKTPLHHAASNGQVEAAVMLLMRGADKTAVDHDGCDAFAFADSLGRRDFVEAVESEILDRVEKTRNRRQVSHIRKLDRRPGL